MDDALTSEVLLSLKDLSVFRDDDPVLVNFSLCVRPGDWVVIRGRNGCGKSTLLKAIVGLIPPTAGSVSVSPYAYLGHGNGLREQMTVGQQLMFLCDWFEVPLKPTPVDHLWDLSAHQLSAGLKRQLALSQFILCQRPLWIMDEPLDNLDAHARAFFTTLMQSHIASGGAILQTSHDPVNDKNVIDIDLI
ncbi:MAG: heme ABC exporter ATP-binding protein CcmA [Candidatus Paracaedibacteraceae bacterium]|nr:heme ABC exporter ATP-binding protein CcmA [Candidatus Paracaedibacteraceae bacterium]